VYSELPSQVAAQKTAHIQVGTKALASNFITKINIWRHSSYVISHRSTAVTTLPASVEVLW